MKINLSMVGGRTLCLLKGLQRAVAALFTSG